MLIFLGEKMFCDFYCDESGNTGTDYLNTKQPIFVYGGWLISSDICEDLKGNLNSILSRYQFGEFKSINILKRKDGLIIYKEIMELMFSKGAVPFSIICEKRYMLAAHIVETFFDPAYNRQLNDRITYPNNFKKSLTEIIACDYEILEKFSQVIKLKSNDLEFFLEINDRLSKIMRIHGHYKLSKLISNLSNENLLEMLDEFEYLSNGGQNRNWLTLTVPILVMLMQKIEVFSSQRSLSVNFYHDFIRGYKDPISHITRGFLNRKNQSLFVGETASILIGYPNIKKLEFVDSKSAIFVQMADLWCGLLNYLFGKAENDSDLNSIEVELGKYLLSLSSLEVWDYTASENLISKFVKKVANRDIVIPDPDSIIRKDCKYYLK